jgi:hypothetical protein
MLTLHHLLPQKRKVPLEPHQVSQKLLAASDAEPPTQEGKVAFTAASHFGYGAACGALRVSFRQLAGNQASRGPCYGIMIYAFSYAGRLPILGIPPPPQRRPCNTSCIAFNLRNRVGRIGETSDFSAAQFARVFSEANEIANVRAALAVSIISTSGKSHCNVATAALSFFKKASPSWNSGLVFFRAAPHRNPSLIVFGRTWITTLCGPSMRKYS